MSSAKNLIEETRGERDEERLSQGIIVGGYQWCEIGIEDRQRISTVIGVPIQDVAQNAWTARSLWKPNHSFRGLLYRIGDYAMFTHPEEGDTVIELKKFVSLNVSGCALVCCYADVYAYCGDLFKTVV